MSTKYPNTGRLNYSKNKIHPKSPDLYGELVLDRAYLKSMLEATDEDEISIKLDAWQNDGNYGTYFSLKVNTYKKSDAQTPPPKPESPIDSGDVPF